MNLISIRLIDPSPVYEQTFRDYYLAINGPDFPIRIHEFRDLEVIGFERCVQLALNARHAGNPDLGLVPHSLFWLLNSNNQMIGSIDLRHELTDALTQFGGHIGYTVHPDHRNQGYATYMLKQMLPIAKEMNIDRLLVTCDTTNIASRKVIQNCSGILENVIAVPDRPVPLERYWISTSL